MARQAARLSDVARSAGVSVATVSRYLNNSLQLPKTTVARIRQSIDALGYQPNPHARSLSRGRSDTLGLLVPDITNPYFAKLAAAVEREAARQGYGLTLCASLNTEDREGDGTLTEPIINSHRRIVILDEDVAGVKASKVFSDNEQGGFLAGRHLVEMGHRRIAFFGGPGSMHSTRA